MYIELHAASAFSFLQGASLPEAIVERAAALDYPALALLDADGVYGAPRFHKAAKQAGLKAIIGAELTIDGTLNANPRTTNRELSNLRTSNPRTAGSRIPDPGSRIRIPPWRLPVLVESQTGYQNLCRLVTRMKMRAGKGEGALTLEEFDGFTAGLIALAGRPMLDAAHYGVGGLLDRIVGLFGRANVCVELQRHLQRDDEAANVSLESLARAFGVPMIATNDVRFAEPADRPLFDVLTCVRHKTTLDAAGRKLARNAERYLKSPKAMAELFADRRAAVAATQALADRLEYTMADLGYRFPKYPVPDGETEMSFLRHITDAGARERYRPYHDKARAQIERELALIEKLELAGYFLIVWDIVNYCRQQDVLVQGRGSAANSAVCYSLGITAVDPIKMDLLFERFLSEERGEWPDIDLDLPSGDRRERVIQHVYEKYGRLGAAMTANVITYRSRSAAREVGKALSLDDADIDRLAKVMNNFEFTDPNDTLGRHVADAGLSLSMPRMKTFAELWLRIQDLPRHLGQHSGGMVICQGALDSVVPLEPATMPGRVVIQWDKDDCADMGIVKVDLLGLGMMAALQDAIAMVNTGIRDPGSGIRNASDPSRERIPDPAPRQAQGALRLSKGGSRIPVMFDLAHLPMDDAKVYEMLQQAETIGVFQVESRAQMATLPRLKPTHFYDLVVQVAIIRPGPIVGDMVHPYLNRRAGREQVVPLHPCLEPILARTLGVPLFQEQLLRMAMAAAGFTGGQAEELRRAMGFKRSEKRMKQIEVQLRDGMTRNGITGETAERIINSITSFALYGFPESHAASFALLAYASAYLKVHYPAAFYTALLNNQPMGFYHPASLVKDAQRRGVRFHPIDVQQSDWLCRVEEDGAIRLGFMYVNGLRKEVGQAMAAIPKGQLKLAPTNEIARAGVNRPENETVGAGFRRPENETVGAGFRRPENETVGAGFSRPECTKCGSDDETMIEVVRDGIRDSRCGIRETGTPNDRIPDPAPRQARGALRLSKGGSRIPTRTYFCNTCAHEWTVELPPVGRFASIEQVVQRTGLRRDELTTLADIGALNAFTNERRSALWQVERAIRPAGELFREEPGRDPGSALREPQGAPSLSRGGIRDPGIQDLQQHEEWEPGGTRIPDRASRSPLPTMDAHERLRADYAGTSLTIGPHPMSLRRDDLALRGVLRAVDLPAARDGRRVRVAGMVITRQRPGTAKGFVFLTLEDETGISNIIVRPDLFDRERLTVIDKPFLLVEGVLQHQDGVLSVRAERLQGIDGGASVDAHDFY